MLKAMVFDLDGTLVITDDDYLLWSVGEALSRHDIKATDEQKRHIFHLTDPSVYDALGIPSGLYWPTHREIDTAEERVKHTRCAPDIAVVRELYDAGISIGIVTGARPAVAAAETELVRRAIGSCFGEPLCAHRFAKMPHKPDPTCLLLAFENLGVHSEDAAYIGDIPLDALTARNAGALDILIDRDGRYGEGIATHQLRSLYELRDGLLWSPRRTYSPPARSCENRPACPQKS